MGHALEVLVELAHRFAVVRRALRKQGHEAGQLCDDGGRLRAQE